MAVPDCIACCAQAADAEARKYEALQQTEQSAFVASVADLEQAVGAMQSYTDMSSAKAVFEEVGSHALSTPEHAEHMAALVIKPCPQMPC